MQIIMTLLGFGDSFLTGRANFVCPKKLAHVSKSKHLKGIHKHYTHIHRMRKYYILQSFIFLWSIIFSGISGTSSDGYDASFDFQDTEDIVYLDKYFSKDRDALRIGILNFQRFLDINSLKVKDTKQAKYVELLEKYFYPHVTDLSNDEYKILEKIGDGVYSTVYEAVHVPTQTKVAIKVFKNTYGCAHIPFHKEIWTYFHLLSMEQDNCDRYVAPIFTILIKPPFPDSEDTIAPVPCIVYERMEMSLLDYMLGFISREKSRNLKNSAIRYIAFGILLCLSFLHRNYIIHADLKPENVMLNVDPKQPLIIIRIVLIDFGSSYNTHPITLVPMGWNNELVGTPSHRSPELFLLGVSSGFVPLYYNGYPVAPFSYSVDIWAAGLTIVEMFDNGFIFAGTNQKLLNSQLMHSIQATRRNTGSLDYAIEYTTIVDRFIKVMGWTNWLPRVGYPMNLMIPKQNRLYYFLLKFEKTVTPMLGKDEYGTVISQLVIGSCADAWNLIRKMLIYDPSKRITAADALNDSWFSINSH